jgi:hypothetical protein
MLQRANAGLLLLVVRYSVASPSSLLLAFST